MQYAISGAQPNRAAGRRVFFAILTAAAVSLLFVLVIPWTFGQFSAQTVNVDNEFTAGTLEMTNSESGAIVTASNIKPGDILTGTVTITNSGSLPATMTLSQSGVANGGPVGSSNLAAQLDLVIDDDTTGATIYSGKFDALTANTAVPGLLAAPQWAAGEAHTFTFTVTFPLASGNEYQGTSATATFEWDGVQ